MIVRPTTVDSTLIQSVNILPAPRGNRGGKKRKYKDIVCAFDIETTRIKEIEQSVMYVWQFQFGNMFTVVGRLWEEFIEMLERLVQGMKDDEWVVIYVHNLSFEFQFLSGVYPFLPEEVFAIESRKILRCDMFNHFEFRCSYLHSNMSLDAFTKKMGAKHCKLSGDDFDYSKPRFWWTPLTDLELSYCVNDVLGLVEAITIEMEKDGDNLYTVPITSTGYVRRDIKQAMKKCNYKWLKSLYPDYETYIMLREAFRGGNCHANRYFAGQVLANVGSIDRSSSYPETQCNLEFPITPFKHVSPAPDFDTVVHNIKVRHKAVLMRVAFTNVSLLNVEWGCPYISRDKCRNISKMAVYDNGRILSADYFEMTITDIDLMIILSEYKFDSCAIIDYCHATYGKLPKQLTDAIEEYYIRKTELKGVDGQEYFYMKSKNKLNAIYGMSAQDPVKESILYDNGEYKPVTLSEEEQKAILDKKKGVLPYQWGVWCTAHARNELEKGIRIAHQPGAYFIYTDTDSVKYIGNVDISKYNNAKVNLSKKNGAYATDKHGVTHYMGVYEDDGKYFRFKTLGAKKYCYTDVIQGDGFVMEGALHITVSGVPKKDGAKELAKEGGIEHFREGFVFNAGKLESQYNDNPEIMSYVVDGKTVAITKNVNLKPTTYVLGITEEYADILDDAYSYAKAQKILQDIY